MFNGKEVVHFLYPTTDHPQVLRIVYDGKDAAKLLKEFGWKKRRRISSTTSSLSADVSVDTMGLRADDKETGAATAKTSRELFSTHVVVVGRGKRHP